MKKDISKGFGFIVLIIILGAIALITGGVYYSNLSSYKSSESIESQALQNAKNLSDSVQKEVDKIQAEDGKSLDLSNRGLTSVPSYIFNMTNLETLDLSDNNLTGALPAEIRHLKNLRVLNVGNNKMTGIPAEIGQLHELESVDYSGNQITGLPYEISNLKNLRILNLTGNDYSKLDLDIIKKELPNLKVVY